MTTHPTTFHMTVTRRSLVGTSLGAAALTWLGPVASATPRPASPAGASLAQAAPAGVPASWRTWILTSASELRPAAPGPVARAETDELEKLLADPSDTTAADIARWNGRLAILPWTEQANDAYNEFKLTAIRQYRANALLQTAMADAVLAAYDAQDAYQRPGPSLGQSHFTPISPSSYPSAEAAVAGAAAAVLTALLPDAAPNRFTDLANEAAMARLQAGLNFRSDTDAGLALGKAIGERAIALAATDQPGSAWDGSGQLSGPGYWVPTPPAFVKQPQEPLAPTWHRWVLESADQFRAAPPPAYDSSVWQSQLDAVREATANRTLIQSERAHYWQNSAASTLWDTIASELIARDQLDLPHAARALALTAVAVADAEIACWDSKYTYWTERPITADPELDVLFPTPPFPSYPSAHSTASNAAAVVLAHLFPEDATDLLALATEAAASRAWAGIHYPLDNDAGTLMGRQIGYLIAARARGDGAE
jgi:membrane-associated phospholipid phosphatase